jgi:hypothetical protein
MRNRRLDQRVADAFAWIQRRKRILENHLQRGPLAWRGAYRHTPQQYLALGGRVQAANDAAQRGLAAAGFADQANHLARRHSERDTVKCVHRMRPHRRTQPCR